MANELPPKFITLGDCVLRFEDDEVGEEFEEKARNELRETPDVVKNAMEEFKRLIEDDKDLIFPQEDINLAYQFLRPCKFYPESAYEKLRTLYLFKCNNPRYYANLLPSTIRNAIMQEIVTVFPYRSQKGRRIVYLEAAKWDVKKVSLLEMIRCVLLLVEIAVTEYRTQICGVEVIFNLKGLSLQHVCQFGPTIASHMLHWIQECVPLRFKAAHIINQPYLFNMLFAVFKPFLNEKIRNRMFFHGKDYESLFTHIDRKFLPQELGGELTLQPFDRNELHRLICVYESEFEERMHCGYKRKST